MMSIDHHFMVQVVLVWSGGSPPSMCETLNTLTVHKRLHMSQIGPVVNLISQNIFSFSVYNNYKSNICILEELSFSKSHQTPTVLMIL